jgi:hypothetical protein
MAGNFGANFNVAILLKKLYKARVQSAALPSNFSGGTNVNACHASDAGHLSDYD